MDLFSKCKELYEKIRYFEYGIPVDGVIKPVPSAEYYVKNYHFLKPEEFEKYGGGICWDYVEYERKFLEVNDIDFNQYYLITNTPPNYDTHTFITVKDGDDLIYIESSFKRVEHIIDGVQKFKTLEDIVRLITTNMWYCNDNDKHFDEFKYDVCKFKGHPQYGCTCEEYMKWMDDNSDIVIQDVTINPKKINNDELPVEEFSVNKINTKFNQFVCESANDPEEYDEALHDHIADEDDVYNESWVDSVDSELIMESQKRRDSYLKKIKYDPKTQTVDTGILDTKTGKNIRIKIKSINNDGAYYQSARSKINEFKTENGYDLNKFLDNVYINMPKDIFNKKKNAGLTVFYHEIGHFLFDLVRYFRDHLNPSDVERLMKWDTEVEKYTASLNEDMVDNLNNHDIDAEEMMADLNATSKVSRHSYDHVHKKSLDQNKNIKGLKKQEKILNSKIEQAKANKDSKQLMKLLNEKDVIDTQNAALREDATSTKARLKVNEELTKSLNEPIKEYAIQESWTDFKNGVHPSSGLMFHVSLKNDMDGKTINPQLPSYITDGGELDDNYQEDTKTKRLCVSPSIEGCLIAILNYNKIREHVGDKFYVYTPEKPFSQYKHKTNKEIVKDKLVFDANITKEAWILEPCKLKLYGIIKLKKVKDLKKKPTVEKNIKMNTIKLDYEWIMTPKASGKFNKAIGDSPDKEDDKKEKPIKEYDNILVSNDEFFMESQATRNKVLERLDYNPKDHTINTGIKRKDGTPIRVELYISKYLKAEDDNAPVDYADLATINVDKSIKNGSHISMNDFINSTYIAIEPAVLNQRNNGAIAHIYHEIGHILDTLNKHWPDQLDPSSKNIMSKINDYVNKNKDVIKNTNLNKHDSKPSEYVADTYAVNKTSKYAHAKANEKMYAKDLKENSVEIKRQNKAKEKASKHFSADDNIKKYTALFFEKEKLSTEAKNLSKQSRILEEKEENKTITKEELAELDKLDDAITKNREKRKAVEADMHKLEEIMHKAQDDGDKFNATISQLKSRREEINNGNHLRSEIPSSFKESYDCLMMDNEEFFGLMK